jgi:hypothetical protein
VAGRYTRRKSDMGSGSSGYGSGRRFGGNQAAVDVHVGVISDGRFSPLPTSLITTPTLYSPTAIAW